MNGPRRAHLAGHVVVWIAQLSQNEDALGFLEPCLDSRDRERAARFKFVEDRARFILGRGLLRKCVGSYLDQAPETIALAYTELGRPVLPHDDTIQFSLSHTSDIVALAVTSDARVGIDVEAVQRHPDLLELAERIFSPIDFHKFQVLPAHETLAAFYRAWTRKEAYLKARGEGITEGLPLISASLGPEKDSSITDSREEESAPIWRIVDLPVPPGYMGCVACDDPHRSVECHAVHLENGEFVRASLALK